MRMQTKEKKKKKKTKKKKNGRGVKCTDATGGGHGRYYNWHTLY